MVSAILSSFFVREGFSCCIRITLDHVYVSPPWELRDGLPYSIARIMEFLPPENASGPFAPSVNGSADATSFKGKGKEKEPITRVRLAWYYRPSDLSDRAVADSRLLYAAIFSEIQPVAFLRAKCHVKHKDKIADLSGWKKRPDRFYFSKLFDPYIKKEYEVIRSLDVRNCEWCLQCHCSDWRFAFPSNEGFV